MKEVKTIQSKEEKKFWGLKRNREIYEVISEGGSIDSVAKDNGYQPLTVAKTISNPFFDKRMRALLSSRLYELQIKKITDLPEIYESLKKEFSKRLVSAKSDTIIREFLKLLGDKTDTKIINTDLINIIFASVSGNPKAKIETIPGEIIKPKSDLAKDFGYESLPSPNATESTTTETVPDSPMDKGHGTANSEEDSNRI